MWHAQDILNGKVTWRATPSSQSGTPKGQACHALLKVLPLCRRDTPRHPSGTLDFIGSSFSSLENTTSVPYYETGVSRPSFALSSCWRATPHLPSGTPESTGPLISPLENTTSVPGHETGVSHPSFAIVPEVGVPRLDVQVARQSEKIELACNAFDTK
ncbi:hypothetical protein AHAS_Ahas05G0149200 [Arachis hypogaea]